MNHISGFFYCRTHSCDGTMASFRHHRSDKDKLRCVGTKESGIYLGRTYKCFQCKTSFIAHGEIHNSRKDKPTPLVQDKCK